MTDELHDYLAFMAEKDPNSVEAFVLKYGQSFTPAMDQRTLLQNAQRGIEMFREDYKEEIASFNAWCEQRKQERDMSLMRGINCDENRLPRKFATDGIPAAASFLRRKLSPGDYSKYSSHGADGYNFLRKKLSADEFKELLRIVELAKDEPYNGKQGQGRKPFSTPERANGMEGEEGMRGMDDEAKKKHLHAAFGDDKEGCRMAHERLGLEYDEAEEHDEEETPDQSEYGEQESLLDMDDEPIEGELAHSPEEGQRHMKRMGAVGGKDNPPRFKGRPSPGGAMDNRSVLGQVARNIRSTQKHIGMFSIPTESEQAAIRRGNKPKRSPKQIAKDAKVAATTPSSASSFFAQFPDAAKIGLR